MTYVMSSTSFEGFTGSLFSTGLAAETCWGFRGGGLEVDLLAVGASWDVGVPLGYFKAVEGSYCLSLLFFGGAVVGMRLLEFGAKGVLDSLFTLLPFFLSSSQQIELTAPIFQNLKLIKNITNYVYSLYIPFFIWFNSFQTVSMSGTDPICELS